MPPADSTGPSRPVRASRLIFEYDGDQVRLSNERGVVVCRVRLSADIRYDTVFLPFHYAGGESANLLTEAATDPVSGMPEFKSTIVEVSAVRDAAVATERVDAHG